jgi:hypothetical protein
MAVLRVCLLIVLLLAPGGTYAAGEEPLSVEAGVKRRTVAVGDTFNLHLDLDWEDGVDIKPLAIGDRLGGFVVRDVREGVASRVGERFTRRISLLLTTFELGTQTVPPVAVVYLTPDGETLKAETLPVEIAVASILPDDAGEIRDIKDPIAVPRRWKDLILSYALLVGLAEDGLGKDHRAAQKALSGSSQTVGTGTTQGSRPGPRYKGHRTPSRP